MVKASFLADSLSVMKGLYFCNTACPIDIFVFGGIFFDVSPNNVFRNPISPPWQSCLNLQGTQYPYLGTPYYFLRPLKNKLLGFFQIGRASCRERVCQYV